MAEFKKMGLLFVLMTSMLLSGCTRSVVMPDVNLNTSLWQVWSGQAVWTPGPKQPTVVGEVLLALNHNGDVYVNLAKPPLDIFTAQTHDRFWSINVIEGDKSHSGRGKPPKQFIWFYLPRVLAEETHLHAHWHTERPDSQSWIFTNGRSGEIIQLVLDE